MVDIYISSVSPKGFHQCVIDGNAQSVWMYLHDLEQNCVLSDAPICCLIEPISYDEFKKTYKRADTPPFVKGYTSDRAIIPDIESSRLNIQWADDEISVVASIDDEPFSMIIRNEKNSYSKSIKQSGPWGRPWDETIYKEIFGYQNV
jgi:hypothetical protein